MKTLIVLLGIIMVTGCAGMGNTSVPTEPATVDASAEVMTVKTDPRPAVDLTMQKEVEACVNSLMNRQAHVLDATKACSHIYGLTHARTQRTVDLD